MCRRELAHMLGVDLPLAEVDVEVFVGLYRDGKTASHPEAAAAAVVLISELLVHYAGRNVALS